MIENESRKIALYPRVSTIMQAEDGDSLDEQTERMKAFCLSRGWDDIAIYREEGFSGKNLNRPAFQRMMADIHKGRINTVVVKKIDRLSRSILDFENIYNIFEAKGVDLISLSENFDTSTAVGRAIIRVVLVFAVLEREQTSERTIDIMAHRAMQGLFNGGYPRKGYDLKDNCLIINETEAPIVREIFETYKKLGSLSETAIAMNEKGYRMKTWVTQSGKSIGGKKFTKNNLDRLLKDPVYTGKNKYKDKLYPGQHQAIIDEALFDSVQCILSTNSRTKTGFRESGNKAVLRGLVRCGACHSFMVPSFANSKGKRYFYYRCTSDNDKSKDKCYIGSVNAKKLEQLVVDELKFITRSPAIINGIVEQATAEQKERFQDLQSIRKGVRAQLTEVDMKAKNITDVLGSEGKDAQIKYLLQELKDLDERAKQLHRQLDNLTLEINTLEEKLLGAEVIRENVTVFADVYDHLTDDEKYDLLHILIKEIVYYEDAYQDPNGRKTGKAKIDIWEIPSLRDFAESHTRDPNFISG